MKKGPFFAILWLRPLFRPNGGYFHMFDFFSETAERNLTKFDRKQDLTKSVFSGRSEKQDDHPAYDWLSHFRLLLWNRWIEFNETCQEARDQRPLRSLCLGPIGITRWLSQPLIELGIFDFFSETASRNSMKLDRKHYPNVLYQVCVFRVNWKTKMANPDSDWQRHFWLLLWNCWTEFKETRQKARCQRPLSSLCFPGPLENQDGHPVRSVNKGGTLYSGARYVALWARCYLSGGDQIHVHVTYVVDVR